MHVRRRCVAAVLTILFPGCGGSGGGPTPPSPPGGGTPTSQNPCPASSITADSRPSRGVEDQRIARREDKKRAIDGDPRYRVFDSLSLHREAQQWRARQGIPPPTTA